MKDMRILSAELGVPQHDLEHVAAQPSKFYIYRRKKTSKKVRTFRIPRGRLREILDAIKVKLLDRMPLPDSVHGWRKRRSPKTYAKPHIGKSRILNCDIQDFFPSVGAGRVYGFWTRAGYDTDAARILTRLTTLDNQLPQGSPTSQSLGNQVLGKLHRRFGTLARRHELGYSSYGDEFTMSGRKRVKRLKGLTVRIVGQEGFTVSPVKIKDKGRHERQELAGNTVNKKISPGRAAFRELRAILHNCLKFGPENQNRAAHQHFQEHLRGRIAQFEYLNPALGVKLLADFNRIVWPKKDPQR